MIAEKSDSHEQTKVPISGGQSLHLLRQIRDSGQPRGIRVLEMKKDLVYDVYSDNDVYVP